MSHKLEALKQIFEEIGFVARLNVKSDVIEVDHLELELPFDLQGRRRMMMIKVEDVGWLLQEQDKAPPNFSFIQCLSILPIAIVPEAALEIIRSVNFFNRGLPTPVFVFDEGLSKVFLSYTFPCNSKEIPKELILPVFQSILLWIDSGGELFEKIASGEALEEIIQESFGAS